MKIFEFIRRQMMPLAALCCFVCLGMLFAAPARAQAPTPTPGQNVNMVSGTQLFGGDPFLQRQNESAIAVSTRNFLHLLAGANDYRTVDLPYPDVSSDDNTPCPANQKCAEPWVGVFKSRDGGETWQSVLLPGYPQDVSQEGLRSPLKKFTTASDPVVRAGTNGLFYFSGIAFNRGTNNGVVFVARFMDLNNKENGDVTQGRDSIRYVDTVPVAFGTSTQFLDKPVIAVDVPRGNHTCTIHVPQDGTTILQTVPAGNIYLAYTSVTNPSPGVFLSQIYLKTSRDCGATWSSPSLISQHYAKSQGATIQIDAETGIVFVAWRVFATQNQHDAIVVAASLDGHTFTPGFPVVTLPPYNPLNPTGPSFFDQATTGASFRTNALPALAVGDSGFPWFPGPLYLAWSQRGVGPNGDARIMMLAVPGNGMFSENGFKLPTPIPVDNGPLTDQLGNDLLDDGGNALTRGHQFMPQITITGGKLTVAYYDQREDHTLGLFTPNIPFKADPLGRFYGETRQREGELPGNPNAVFTPFLTEAGLTTRRHTIGVRLAEANVSLGVPVFTYANVTQFRIGDTGTETGTITSLQELQVNPPNLPLFQQGTVPFIGDYLDIAGLTFLPPSAAGGQWKFNRSAAGNPVQYATWTSNQDVRAPADGVWTHYTPVGVGGGQSIFDPTATVPNCVPGQAGMRNQNIYSSRITQGLLLSSPQTSKPLSTGLERAFVVTVQNFTNLERSFRLTLSAPTGVYASFQQVTNPPNLKSLPPALTSLDLTIPAHSGIARSVFAFLTTSTNSAASIIVNAAEITTPAGGIKTQPCTSCTAVVGGLTSFVILNPEGTVPPLVDPDGAASGIASVELYNSILTIPNPSNPNPSNPNPSNPNPSNPNPSNPNPSNPNPSNPNPSNVDLASIPNPSNPNPSNTTPATSTVVNTGLSNPNPSNTNLSDQPVSDAIYTVTDTGDTSASFHVVLVGQNPGHSLQLIITKAYETPNVSSNADGTPGCALVTQTQTIVQSNIINPVVSPNPSNASLSDTGITDPSDNNATFQLRPHEQAFITLRGFNVSNDPALWLSLLNGTAPVVISQAFNTDTNTRSVTVPGGVFILTSVLPDGVVGSPYSVTLQSLGGTAPLQWSVDDPMDLPSGFSINPNTGTLSFFPPREGGPTANTYSFTVRVTDAARHTNTKILTLRLFNLLTVTTASPLTATQGTNYEPLTTFFESGGIGPYSWTPVAVDGLSLSSSGAFNGTPTIMGSFNFTVQVTDSASPAQIATKVMTLNVGSPVAFLFFATQPSTTTAGSTITPSVRVQAEDRSESPLLVPGINITLAIQNNPSNGTLSGTTTQTTDATGIATFNDLSIDRGGNGYTLLASSGAISARSSSFNIVLLVANTSDSGTGSLRQAILNVNAQPGSQPVGIVFNIPGNGVQTIAPQRDLETLTHPAILDATTQPGYAAGTPIIELNGSAGIAVNGLHITAGSSTVRGFVINRFSGDGILLDTNGGDVIQGNYVGTDVTGTVAQPNSGNGIQIIDTPNNTIGGTTSSTRNVISGNAGEGLRIDGAAATGNLVQGNYIGTNVSGSVKVGNTNSGIYLRRAPGNSVIGNTVSGNLGFAGIAICGNVEFCGGGLDVGNNASGNVVQGNLVGTNPAGTTALGNNQRGVSIDGAPNTQVGGTTADAGNVISFNGTTGVDIFSLGADGNKIQGNVIANNNVGISVVTGTGNTLGGNSISGHTGLGIDLAPLGVNLNTFGGAHNFPVVTSAQLANGTTTIIATLNSTSSAAFTIEFFSNLACNPSGNGEGATFLGSTNVVTNVDGNASFSLIVVGPAAGNAITTTATDASGSTSEFSACVTVSSPAPAPPTAVNLTPTPSAGTLMDGQSFNETRAADVKVLTAGPLTVSSMTISGLNIGSSATSALVGARIYSSSGVPVASANAAVNAGSQQTITIPIAATLASGATYRVGFYVQTTPLSQGSGTVFVVASFPYTEPTGRFQIVAAWDSSSDAFPTIVNTALPQMTITVAP